MKRFMPLSLLSLMLISSGCSTVITKRDGRWGSKYSGTKCAASRTPKFWKQNYVGGFMSGLDVAMSAIADTLLLPFDMGSKNKTEYKTPCPTK